MKVDWDNPVYWDKRMPPFFDKDVSFFWKFWLRSVHLTGQGSFCKDEIQFREDTEILLYEE